MTAQDVAAVYGTPQERMRQLQAELNRTTSVLYDILMRGTTAHLIIPPPLPPEVMVAKGL